MKRIFFYIIIAITATSCFSSKGGSGGNGGEVTGVGGTAWGEPTPYGMVLVNRGSMKVGPNQDDSLRNVKANPRGMSVDAFWMDQTAVTNSQ